jgi:hypothetical protein
MPHLRDQCRAPLAPCAQQCRLLALLVSIILVFLTGCQTSRGSVPDIVVPVTPEVKSKLDAVTTLRLQGNLVRDNLSLLFSLACPPNWVECTQRLLPEKIKVVTKDYEPSKRWDQQLYNPTSADELVITAHCFSDFDRQLKCVAPGSPRFQEMQTGSAATTIKQCVLMVSHRTWGKLRIRVKSSHKGIGDKSHFITVAWLYGPLTSGDPASPRPRQFGRMSENGCADGGQRGACFQRDRRPLPSSRKVSLLGHDPIRVPLRLVTTFRMYPEPT